MRKIDKNKADITTSLNHLIDIRKRLHAYALSGDTEVIKAHETFIRDVFCVFLQVIVDTASAEQLLEKLDGATTNEK